MFRRTIEREYRVWSIVQFLDMPRGRHKDHARIGGKDLKRGAVRL